MNNISKYISFVFLLVICNYVHSQKVSNKGQEFWVGYGHHQFMETGANDQNMVIYLSAEGQPATVTITLDSSGFAPALWYKKTYNIPANTVIATENMPKGAINAIPSGTNPNYDSRLYTDPPPFGTGGEGIFRKKGIHIQSNVDIVAYAHIFGSVSSGATVLLPVNSWGYKYTSINSRQVNAAGPAYSWFYVIAKENNTRIKITPSVITRLGKPAGTPFTVDLQKGQIYQLIGQSDNDGTGNEFTGSKIESIPGADGNCHAVAAFSGSSRTRGEDVPCGTGSGRDNDMQQMFPEQTWGKKYAVAPFSSASGSSSNPSLDANSFMTSVYKIVVQDPTTVVKKNGVVLTGLVNNLYYKYASNTADLIEADKPISVAQFMSGSSTCNPGDYGDPEMVFVSPIEQSIKKVFFYRNTKQSIYANYVTIIVPTAGLPSLKVDNSTVFNFQYPHPNLPGYTVVIKGWKAAQAQASIVCDSGFNAITYGLGGAESYAYIAGAYLENLNAISGLTNNPGLDTSKTLNPYNCVNTPVRLSVLYRLNPGAPPPIKILVKMSSLGAVVAPNADVLLNPASTYLTDTVTVKGLQYYQYDLPGTYLFNAANTYYIPVIVTNTATGLCTDDERLSIEVVVKPQVLSDFTTVIPTCPTDTVKFTGNSTSNGLNIKKWAWEFPVGSPFNDSSQIVKYVFPGQGTYQVKLTSFTEDACSAEIIKPVNLPSGPTVNFTVSPTSICEGNAVTITPSATSGSQWFWDFGDGTKDTLTNGNPFTHTYQNYGSYSISYTLDNGTSCKPSSIPQVVTVRANPFALFAFPNGCLPSNGIVQFTSNAFAPDGQTVTNHSWNFGDPASGVNNTSTLPSPTHNYTVGNYTITYRAETTNGCFKDTTVNTTFTITPNVQFNALPSVCANVPPFSIANATVTNGVPGTGVYSGPGTTASGIFDPSAAGVGTHTITYQFTSSTGNCVDTKTQQIIVKDVPKAGFSFPVGCLTNSNIQFTDTSKVAAGLTLTYLWNFGEPSSGVNNSSGNQNPSHSYASDGNYSVKLLVSVNGCSDSTTTNVPVSVKPILNYPPLTGVCSSLSPFSVASATVTNGVSGTGIYKGTGITNTNGTFDPTVAGIGGPYTIWYVFTSNMGCVDSISSTISVGSGAQPGFSYPTNCLPNGNFQFTDTSKVPAGPAPTYQWTFDDPASGANNFSSVKSPLHAYTSAGTYNVKLVILFNGCKDSTIVPVPVKIQPILSYPALPPVCGNVTPFSVASATVTNSVTGSGLYFGNGITNSTLGIFSPSIAGANSIITYIFTSSLGCIDSAKSPIKVNPVPDAGFTFPTTCLANGNVQFTDTSKFGGVGVPAFNWDFGEPSSGSLNFSISKNPLHNYSSSGTFNVKQVVSLNGCTDSTIVPVTVRIKPVLTYPVIADVCANVLPYSVANATVTNGVAGSGLYFGNGITNNTLGTFNPSIAGASSQITYIFTSSLGCIDSVKSPIFKVKSVPDAGFTFPTTCLANGNVQFTDTSKFGGVGVPSYSWNFGEPGSGTNNFSTIKNPQHNYSSSGPFSVKQVVSLNGCSDSTIVPVTVRIKPILNYPILSDVCANISPFSIASATVTNGVVGTGLYFGNGITNSSLGTFNPGLAGVNSHNIKYIFTSSLGCIDSVPSTIKVKSVPTASFTYPTGCLPNGLVQFTNTSTGATGGNYVWNFGDPSSGANNTSSAINPQHSYNTFGAYTIKLSATLNGCTDDTTITTTFALQPQLSFPAIPISICKNATPISIATAFVLNGVAGTGTYSGLGVDNAGNFNPAQANVGPNIITYSFKSTLGNCVNTIPRTIIVNPRPIPSIDLTDSVCANKFVVIKSNSTISSGSIVKCDWNIDGFDTTINNSLPFNYLFINDGNFDIRLRVTSDSGCVSSDTIKTVHIGPLPQASFSAPNEICMPKGTVQFTNFSNILQNSRLKYQWNFGDGSAVDTSQNPIHIYNTLADTAFVNLKVISNFGCIDDTTIAILFRRKPYVNFLPQSDTLCQGQQIMFYSLSNPPVGSEISSYTWDFGDGGTLSNDTNAIRKFTVPGDYLVRLSVKTNNGCIGDSSRMIRVNLQPVVDAGPSFYAHIGEFVIFNPTVNSSSLKFEWTPTVGLNSSSILRPVVKATAELTYYLTAIGVGGCKAVDSLKVNILNPVNIPNAFSPNGDGVNDRWELRNLSDYPNSSIEVFNRYGRTVFKASGNVKSWDGTQGGSPLPIGTYYYIIDLKDGSKPISGYVTILK